MKALLRALARCALFSIFLFSGPLPAQDPPRDGAQQPVRLKNHEPNFVGLTHDSDDDAFMDFTLSLQHPIAAEKLSEGNNALRVLPYFAFTGRFAQYGSRDSSPVVAKRFNPKFFVRHALDRFPADGGSPDGYIDFEYAHESNGQNINKAASFQAAAQDLGNEEHAKDHISRGWDYLGLTAKYRLPTRGKAKLHLYVSRKWYCGCLLQGDMEERYDFEAPRKIGSIRQVSGWRAILKFSSKTHFVDRGAILLDTGTRDTFEYNTARIELGIRPMSRFLGVQFVLWGQSGYLSDIAQYYKKVDSFGAAFVFETLGN